MVNGGSTGVKGAGLTALAWLVACGAAPRQTARPDAREPDTSLAYPQDDADTSTTGAVIKLDVPSTSSTYCLDPRTLDADQPPPPVFAVSGCLWHALSDGRAQAVFTWSNQTGQDRTAAYGPANSVAPGAENQGQPMSFGNLRTGKFAVPFDGSLATWTVLGQVVTVSSASPDCGSTCSYFEQPGCLDCAGWLVDTCTTICADGTCTDTEACDTCPADCNCNDLVPLVDCVIPLAGGKKVVSFGYRAGAGAGLAIGPGNQFLSGPPWRGQPTHFDAGEHHSVFQVTYDGPDVAWMLAGTSATAPADAPVCSQNCASACPRGTLCVADRCQGSCGDGLCVERCDSCVDDCACPAGMICLGDACGSLPTCGGVGPECGIAERFGVQIDCGPCPDGEGCDHGFCELLCSVPQGPQGGP